MTGTTARCKIIPLTTVEREMLQEHELIISQGVKAFIAVGLALLAIRDDKLYRTTHKTFEEYCRDRWDISKSRSYQLMEAAQIASEMSTSGGQIIENERQARALASVPSHLRKKILKSLKDAGAEITEQAVTKAVNALLEQKRAEAKEHEQAGTSEEDDEDEADYDAERASADAKSGTNAKGNSNKNTARDPRESATEGTLRRAAAKHAKERLYLARSLEYLRLAVKNLRKVRATDLETEEARQAAREGLDAADAVFSDVRGWLAAG